MGESAGFSEPPGFVEPSFAGAGDSTGSAPSSSPPEPPNLAHHLIYVRAILSEDEARRRLAYFRSHMYPCYPIVALPDSFDEMLHSTPVLLLTCIYATTIADHRLSAPGALNTALNAALDRHISRVLTSDLYINARGFSLAMIHTCIILALWREPPGAVDHYKAQMDLVASLSVSLCMDVGNVALLRPDHAASARDRDNLRAFLSVYCSCGLLGFLLPRFRLVLWSWRHKLAAHRLLLPRHHVPSADDVFLCRYSRFICVSQQLHSFLLDHGVHTQILRSVDPDEHAAYMRRLAPDMLPRSAIAAVGSVLHEHEAILAAALADAGCADDSLEPVAEAPKGKYVLLFTYYQVLMVAHDNLVSWGFALLTRPEGSGADSVPEGSGADSIPEGSGTASVPESSVPGSLPGGSVPGSLPRNSLPERSSHLSAPRFSVPQHSVAHLSGAVPSTAPSASVTPQLLIPYINRFAVLAQKLLHLFVAINASNSVDYPTFFMYRALHALVCLIRIQILLKSDFFAAADSVDPVHGLLQLLHSQVVQIVQRDRLLMVFQRVAPVLDRISRWVNIVCDHRKFRDINIDFIGFTDMSKGLEIEKLAEPQRKRAKLHCQNSAEDDKLLAPSAPFPEPRVSADFLEMFGHIDFSIQEIFKELDEDVVRYLNPFDTNDGNAFSLFN